MRNQNIAKIRKGMAVGSALFLGASLGESVQGRPTVKRRDVNTLPDQPITALDIDKMTATIRHLSVSMPAEPQKWTKSDARRFAELATKRASEMVSSDEEKEFELLQRRRRLSYAGSSDDIMTEWRRRRFIGDVLNILSRNVRFLKTEDQARLRAVRET